MIRPLLLVFFIMFMSGCTALRNPFETTATDVSDVYYDEFPDVPLPRNMVVLRDTSLVSVTQEGAKIGLLTTEGNYDMSSLATAMVHNLTGQGWTLRAMLNGRRMMQVYEKDSRTMTLYYYPQLTTVAMEIWMALRLPDGVLPSGGSLGYETSTYGYDEGNSSYELSGSGVNSAADYADPNYGSPIPYGTTPLNQ